jgi:preprotein translocase subunit SecD
MNTLKTRLQDADPLRRERPALDALRERLSSMPRESAVIEAARVRRAAVPRMVTMTMIVLAVLATAYGVWSRGATPVLAAVRFEVRLAESQPAPDLIVARVPGAASFIYLHPEVVIDNDDIARASVVQNGPNEFAVAVDVLPSGAERLRRATAAHVGRPLAIVIDGTVVMAPTVRGAIGDSAMITGHYTQAEAEKIARGMQRP